LPYKKNAYFYFAMTGIEEHIHVIPEVFYLRDRSDPTTNQYAFAYRIRIVNSSKHIVQLVHRNWIINDGNGNIREVEGEGVVGEQPTLEPGDFYEYTSWVLIHSDCGQMSGSYQFKEKSHNTIVEIPIPKFQLIAPFKLN
jgi:ApaG protein